MKIYHKHDGIQFLMPKVSTENDCDGTLVDVHECVECKTHIQVLKEVADV